MQLSIVATPIGNLKDISLRAKEVLTQATLIIAEDTRTTGQLLKLLEIEGKKEFISSHAQSSDSALEKAIEHCKDHEYIVLVTDAGTPAISDPGSQFIDEFRKVYPEAIIVPIPGPSALVAAVSVSGFPGNHVEFVGFVPHKKGRQTLFNTIAETEHMVVMYESPHRILKTLEALAEVLGERQLMIGREMTKTFEEYPRGTASELLAYYKAHPDKVKGEFVVVVAPSYYRRSGLENLV